MSALDQWLRIGETVRLGSHSFSPEEIKVFAAKYDPQRFHMDEEAAKNTVFGALCASGWHTAATWMKYNLQERIEHGEPPWEGPGSKPVFGPSPGIENLKWLKPVYAGETLTFTRTAVSHRPLASRAGWHVVTMRAEAFDSTGAKVLEFDSAVLLQSG